MPTHLIAFARRLVFSALCLALVFLTLSPMSVAQKAQYRKNTSKEPAFETKFWKYLIGNNYKNWAPGPGQSAGFYKGQNPHGELVKTYMNRTAAGTIGNLDVGSVVILENYRSDQTLATISVMYRTTGFNPEGNDWYWVEYQPDGSVESSRSSSQYGGQTVRQTSTRLTKTMGKATQCMQCHRSAGGSDFVFSNDVIGQLPTNDGLPPAASSQVADAGTGDYSNDEIDLLPDDDGRPSAASSQVADAETEDYFGTR